MPRPCFYFLANFGNGSFFSCFLFGSLSLSTGEFVNFITQCSNGLPCARTHIHSDTENNRFFSHFHFLHSGRPVTSKDKMLGVHSTRPAQIIRAYSIPYIAFYKLRTKCTHRTVQIVTRRLLWLCILASAADHLYRLRRHCRFSHSSHSHAANWNAQAAHHKRATKALIQRTECQFRK